MEVGEEVERRERGRNIVVRMFLLFNWWGELVSCVTALQKLSRRIFSTFLWTRKQASFSVFEILSHVTSQRYPPHIGTISKLVRLHKFIILFSELNAQLNISVSNKFHENKSTARHWLSSLARLRCSFSHCKSLRSPTSPIQLWTISRLISARAVLDFARLYRLANFPSSWCSHQTKSWNHPKNHTRDGSLQSKPASSSVDMI